MGRMQAEARTRGAEGVVGFNLTEHDHAWGHATEFFATGTAVRPLRDDHVVTPPNMVVPLTGWRSDSLMLVAQPSRPRASLAVSTRSAAASTLARKRALAFAAASTAAVISGICAASTVNTTSPPAAMKLSARAAGE